MAGAFAHMSVVDCLCDNPDFLSGVDGIGKVMRYAVKKYQNFCELGAVSPDLPYLDFLNANAKGWANVMHYWKTGDIIRAGVSYFADKNLGSGDQDLLVSLAWLIGYSAHVATDLTVHPVLAASGYPYATNAGGHRICELNQDSYIFKKIHGKEADDVRYIENCGISSCCAPRNPEKLHPAVRKLWAQCLSGIKPSEVQMANGASGPAGDPTPDVWFADYTKRLSEIVEHGGGLPLIFRDMLGAEGLCLPKSDHVEMKYITDLKTPTNQPIDYDSVFAMTLDNVRSTWLQLGAALAARSSTAFALGNADLDTGKRDDNQAQVFFA